MLPVTASARQLLSPTTCLLLLLLSQFGPADTCWRGSSHSSRASPPPSRFSVRNGYLVDDGGRVRLFHGFNSVAKGPPFVDLRILNKTRAELYRQWGFNVVRLGAMWAGVEPVEPGRYNDTYLALLHDAVDLLAAHGMYVILDMHQDVLSTAFHAYDGVPRWLIDRLPPARHAYPWPFQHEIDPDRWALGYLTDAVGTAFQQMYDNVGGARDFLASFWAKLATEFADVPNILGYELINEPWAGDVYSDVTLLAPAEAGRRNLAPFYDHLNDAIRTVDQRTPIFYEPVTWGVVFGGNYTGTGFQSVPGGIGYSNRSVLSYHYYCWILDADSAHARYPLWKRVLCDALLSNQVMSNIADEVQRIGGSCFLTEFGLCSPDGDPASVDTAECLAVLRQADRHIHSWTYWDSGFFNDCGGSQLWPFDGCRPSRPVGDINWNVVRAFSRVYAQAIAGTPTSMTFDPDTRRFRLDWIVDPSIERPTEIFVPAIQFPLGFRVRVADGLRWTFSPEKSVLYVVRATDGRRLPLATGFVVVKPKAQNRAKFGDMLNRAHNSRL